MSISSKNNCDYSFCRNQAPLQRTEIFIYIHTHKAFKYVCDKLLSLINSYLNIFQCAPKFLCEPLGAWALIKEKLLYRATNFSFDFIFLQRFITKLSPSLHFLPSPHRSSPLLNYCKINDNNTKLHTKFVYNLL